MDPSTITLLAFSSTLVVGSLISIASFCYRRFCVRRDGVEDWIVTSIV